MVQGKSQRLKGDHLNPLPGWLFSHPYSQGLTHLRLHWLFSIYTPSPVFSSISHCFLSLERDLLRHLLNFWVLIKGHTVELCLWFSACSLLGLGSFSASLPTSQEGCGLIHINELPLRPD